MSNNPWWTRTGWTMLDWWPWLSISMSDEPWWWQLPSTAFVLRVFSCCDLLFSTTTQARNHHQPNDHLQMNHHHTKCHIQMNHQVTISQMNIYKWTKWTTFNHQFHSMSPSSPHATRRVPFSSALAPPGLLETAVPAQLAWQPSAGPSTILRTCGSNDASWRLVMDDDS